LRDEHNWFAPAMECRVCRDAVAKLAWSVPRRAVADRALR
jgi:hypothetical protein